MIPKRIFYTWFGHRPLPQDCVQYMNTWQRYNPQYQIIEINERNFDINQFQFTKKAYQLGKMAFVSDVARIWVINHYGGIYLDTDVEILRPLDSLLQYHQFWGKEDAGLVASGLMFGSERYDLILQVILNEYSKLTFDPHHLVQNSTVNLISHILQQYGLKNDRRFNQLTNQGLVFPPSYFAPLHYWGGGRVTSHSYSIHHYSLNPSWTKQKRSLGRYFVHETMYWFPSWGAFLRWLKPKNQ